jgi:hypothetical protein
MAGERENQRTLWSIKNGSRESWSRQGAKIAKFG